MKKNIVVLFGAPGSGKGTQATYISQKLNLEVLSAGELIRAQIKDKTDFGIKVEKKINEGNLVEDHLIIDLLSSELKKDKYQKGFISDGFPRTVQQCEYFAQNYSKNDNKISLVLLELSEEALWNRIKQRKKEDQREDDNFNILKERLRIFNKKMIDIVKFYNNDLIKIDASQPQTNVFKQICEKILYFFDINILAKH